MKLTMHTINGKEMAIYQGPKNGKSILFLHGNSLSAQTYQHQFDADLSDKYHLVAFDFLGHGASQHADTPEIDYSMAGLLRKPDMPLNS